MITVTPDIPPNEPSAAIDQEILVCPLTGEVIDIADTDSLLDCYERVDRADKFNYATKLRIRELLAEKTEGNAKTRRVAGRRRLAKVTMPDDSWDQSILREAWNSYPKFRDEYLAISSLRVQSREFKKLVNTAGPPDLTTFRDMLTRANRGPQGVPTISIEK